MSSGCRIDATRLAVSPDNLLVTGHIRGCEVVLDPSVTVAVS